MAGLVGGMLVAGVIACAAYAQPVAVQMSGDGHLCIINDLAVHQALQQS